MADQEVPLTVREQGEDEQGAQEWKANEFALHGVLIKIRDLGLPLLGLSRIEPERGKESNLLSSSGPEARGRPGSSNRG